jgi:5-methylcytosine-specific restriction endonuclease McrA
MMTETKTKSNTENILKEDFTKPDGLEMVIVPKNQFLEWFKHMKGIMGEMENCSLNHDPDELWYLCPNCNLTFSQRQHQYFTRMLMRLIQGDFKSADSE